MAYLYYCSWGWWCWSTLKGRGVFFWVSLLPFVVFLGLPFIIAKLFYSSMDSIQGSWTYRAKLPSDGWLGSRALLPVSWYRRWEAWMRERWSIKRRIFWCCISMLLMKQMGRFQVLRHGQESRECRLWFKNAPANGKTLLTLLST